MMSALQAQISAEERERFNKWTEIDGDLEGVEPRLAQAILSNRVAVARKDSLRADFWQVPEGIDCFNDISYEDDGVRGHKLDVYLPHEARVRNGATLPVYVDIHGGGCNYGYKELNRNFNVNLAAQGFAVFSIDYRPVPQTDFMGQMHDIYKGLAWVKQHLCDYPADPDAMFITGDSVGGTFALYILGIDRSAAMAQAFGIEQSGIDWKGGALISGFYDLTSYVDSAVGRPIRDTVGFLDGWDVFSPAMFPRLAGAPEHFVDLNNMAGEVDLPPVFLNTSNDDFLEFHTFRLAEALSCNGQDFELHDVYAPKGQALGHVYPVGMTWLPESRAALSQIREFSYSRF